MKDKLLEARMVIANVSGMMYGLSELLKHREPEASQMMREKAERLDKYLEPHIDAD